MGILQVLSYGFLKFRILENLNFHLCIGDVIYLLILSLLTGSPWKVSITDPSKMSAIGPGLDYVHVHRLTWFDVHTLGKPTDVQDLSVLIRGNSACISTSASVVPSYSISATTLVFL